MLRIYIVLLCAIFISPSAWAVCTLARGQPTTLAINSQLITISADAAIDKTTPIAQYDTPVLGSRIGYDLCLDGTEYGKRVIGLTGQDATTRIYQTNITGIGVKLLFSNGTAFGNFPSTSKVSSPDMPTTLDMREGSFYRVQFFKTDELKLTDPAGDLILSPGLIAYNYLMSDNPSSYMLNLSVDDIKIISTPSCTADGAKTIDFNTVTPALLSAGVSRDLNFSITCKSDYGNYAAKASMTTTTPSSDGSFIRVKDAAGSEGKLGIRITDSSGQVMKIDGTTTEMKNSISQGPADFAWKAMLIASDVSRPAGGVFTAKAEIVFDIQ
ncbi:fimbrial protein [Pantoea allii]|nr:fimbrial protein [Pantoea allii]THB85841.1 fimbrial protein [Pantoea allii]